MLIWYVGWTEWAIAPGEFAKYVLNFAYGSWIRASLIWWGIITGQSPSYNLADIGFVYMLHYFSQKCIPIVNDVTVTRQPLQMMSWLHCTYAYLYPPIFITNYLCISIFIILYLFSVTRKKSPNVYKSCPKNDFTRKMIDFDTFTKIA